jgi:Fe-S cluster assembly protein SufD
MEVILEKTKEHFYADFARVRANGDPNWMKQLRVTGQERFRATPYPNLRMEEWRHTNIAPIVETPYRSLLAPTDHGLTPDDIAPFLFGDGDWTEWVMVDGFSAPALSKTTKLPKGVFVENLRHSAQSPLTGAVGLYLGALQKDRNAFTALNTAFLLDGALVYVPKNTRVETPIHLLFVTSARAPQTAAHPRVLIVLEPGAQAVVVSSHVSLAGDTPYLTNLVEETYVGDNAHLERYTLVDEGPQGHLLATMDARHERDSSFEAHSYALGGAIVRSQYCSALAGEGVSCQYNGLVLNDGARLTDTMLNIEHTQPHGMSRIHWKSILEDTSKTVFLGKVHVHPEAQHTDSVQLNNNLLLSGQATIDTKPQLEIYADDVKCTHGATVGAPPEEVLFYFRSRGIDEATARGMLTCGFAGEIIERAALAPIRERVMQRVVAKFSPGKVR